MKMELPNELRDEIELAALLHDIGKIGVPDHVLAKPTALSPQETSLMERHWLVVQDILRGSCAAPGVLDTVAYAAAWFDGRRGQFDVSGEKIPLGARMLAIVDAFARRHSMSAGLRDVLEKVAAGVGSGGLCFELNKPVGFEPGVRFAMREGGRTVGAGIVTEVA